VAQSAPVAYSGHFSDEDDPSPAWAEGKNEQERRGEQTRPPSFSCLLNFVFFFLLTPYPSFRSKSAVRPITRPCPGNATRTLTPRSCRGRTPRSGNRAARWVNSRRRKQHKQRAVTDMTSRSGSKTSSRPTARSSMACVCRPRASRASPLSSRARTWWYVTCTLCFPNTNPGVWNRHY
jgi:hypothetical protein